MKKGRQPFTREGQPVRFGVYLPLTTRKALLKAAIDRGQSATQLVEHLIRQFLAREKRRLRKG